MILDEQLAKPGLQQPRLQMLEVPAIKRELLDVIAPEQIAQLSGDELIGNGLSRRYLQESAIAPNIVRHSIAHCPFFQPNGWEPKRRISLPFIAAPSDQNERGEIRHLGKIETTVNRKPVEWSRGRVARFPRLR